MSVSNRALTDPERVTMFAETLAELRKLEPIHAELAAEWQRGRRPKEITPAHEKWEADIQARADRIVRETDVLRALLRDLACI